jgi:hypothetical protein
MRPSTGFVLLLVSSLWHCVPPARANVAKSRGERDLACPSERVNAYEAGEGLYIARGCGKWVEYDCLSSGGGTVYAGTICIARGQAIVHDDPITSEQ